MSVPYKIIPIFDWPASGQEPMGTKKKVWIKSPKDDSKWLFKWKLRANSDDDWSEKIAAELGQLLGIPCAQVELGEHNQMRGVLSRDFLKTLDAVELIPDNSLLGEVDPDYPSHELRKVAQHTVQRIFQVLVTKSIGLHTRYEQYKDSFSASDVFTGYLLFDTWIGNTDRHHENWAVLRLPNDDLVLSPSYDHAASLGHNVLDREKQQRLESKDRGYQVSAFVTKATSALYASEESNHTMTTLDALSRQPKCVRLPLDIGNESCRT